MNLFNLYELSDIGEGILAFPYKSINDNLSMIVYNIKNDELYVVTDKRNELRSLNYVRYKGLDHKDRIIQLFWEDVINEL